MSNFEKIVASPETLGRFLAALPIATGPWDESFHRTFCDSCIDSCGTKNCDTPGCPHQTERNNPTWWLNQAAEGEQTVHRAVWRNGREEIETGLGMLVSLNNPLRVHIRASKYEYPFGEIPDGENAGTEFERVWETVEEVKKVYPNAEISVELEV